MNTIKETGQCHYIGVRANTIVWHKRLTHDHDRSLSDLHKAATGVPKLQPRQDLDKCDTCLACKIRKNNKSYDSSRHETFPFQGISMDWSFIFQKSKNKERYERLKSLMGNTAYLIIGDHLTPYLDGFCAGDKNPPMEWLNKWLSLNKPKNVTGHYVRVDLGGELARNPGFRTLMGRWGYDIEPTSREASHQNNFSERPHHYIATSIKCILHGANITEKVWDFAFYFKLLCSNITLHNGEKKTPFEQVTGRKPNLSRIRTFGCRVWVKGEKEHKLDVNVKKGIFLGYTRTLKKIYYLDTETQKINHAYHARFDETMQDVANPPPNARRLLQALGYNLPPPETEIGSPSDLTIT